MPMTTSERYGLLCKQLPVIALLLIALFSAACGKPIPITPTADGDAVSGIEMTTFEDLTNRVESMETTINLATDLTQTETPPINATTPVPTPIDPCTWNADYIEDLNLEDGFQVQPATTVLKVWRLENNGTCPWYAGTSLEIVAGDQVYISPQSHISQTASGMIGDIVLEFVSPGQPGNYTSYLRMRAPDGDLFGSVVFIKYSVSNAAPPLNNIMPVSTLPVVESTVTPTQTPSIAKPVGTTPTPSAEPTSTTFLTATAIPATQIRATTTTAPTVIPVLPTTTELPTNTPITVPSSLTPTHSPTVTNTPSPTVEASETLPPNAVSQSVEEDACAYRIDSRFINVTGPANNNAALDLDLTCGTSDVITDSGSAQEFITVQITGYRSLMLWQQHMGTIWVFQGTSLQFGNLTPVHREYSWPSPTAELFTACAAAVENEALRDFIMPVGNIGALWCVRNYNDSLGWSLAPEVSVMLSVQNVENGQLIQATSGGQVLYSIAVNTNNNTGMIIKSQ